ncbi:MAG: anti-sigma factor [Cyanobacteria bacterium J083]|nr:MAG: anti-sigma factor [Cyanobacteria bacterium J083]
MTSNFDASNQAKSPLSQTKTDKSADLRFELLSAYLDGEVTAKERQQVQKWLDEEEKTKQVYNSMRTISDRIKTSPLPPTIPTISSQELSQQVFGRIEKRQRHRKIWLWASGAIATVILGGISTLVPGENVLAPKFATNSLKSPNEGIAVALNEPTIKIPQVNQ